MVIELFYPKKMKDAIDELRSKDDLNEEVLKSLNRSAYLLFFLTVILSYAWLFKEIFYPYKGLEAPLLFCTITTLYYPFHLLRVWRNCMASYVYGEKTDGVVVRVFYILHGGVVIYVRNESMNNTIHKIHSAYPITLFKIYQLPEKGSEISYYSSSNNKYKPNPHIRILLQNNCLKKSLFESNEY